MWNAGLDEAQAWIQIAGRNINNLRYADDATLTAESKEELKSLLMRVKEESEKSDLKVNIQEAKIIASGSITSWQVDREKMKTVVGFIFLGSKNKQTNKKNNNNACSLEEKLRKFDSILKKQRYHF